MYNITQKDRKSILEMHSKMKKPLISEQVDVDLKNKLNKILTDGCVKNGEIVTMQSKNPKLQFAIKQESTKTPGKFRYFFADGRVGNFDDNGKFQFLPGKLDCTEVQQATQQATVNTDIARELEQYGWKERKDIEVTDTELSQLYQKHPKYNLYKLKVSTAKTGGYTPEQQAFINQWRKNEEDGGETGYVEKLTPEQLASGTYQKVKVEGSEQYFPGGLIMYKPAAKEQDKKLCRDKVKLYYKYWKDKREDITQSKFDQLKSQVQACANQHKGKWGGMFSNVDNYIEELQGGTDGPLSYGEDAKWRLK